MKKFISLLICVLFLFGLAACGETAPAATDKGNVETDPTDTLQSIWDNVEEETLTVAFQLPGQKAFATLGRDGSVQFDYVVHDFEPAGYDDYDAEVAMYKTYYGTYEETESSLVITCDAQDYRRIVVRGEDAEEYKTAYAATNLTEEMKDIFDKGVVQSVVEGTLVLSLSVDEAGIHSHSMTKLDKDGLLLGSLELNADGSGTEKEYYPNGQASQVTDYKPDGETEKRTAYLEDGTVEYVETYETIENGSATVRRDADGNELIRAEYTKENIAGGTRTTSKTIENGVETYVRILENYDDGREYNYFKEINGDIVTEGISISPDGYNTTYHWYEATENGKRIAYTCFEYFLNVEPGDLRERRVEYNSESDTYVVQEEFYDPVSPTGTQTEIPADQYTHADWEAPTWPNF